MPRVTIFALPLAFILACSSLSPLSKSDETQSWTPNPPANRKAYDKLVKGVWRVQTDVSWGSGFPYKYDKGFTYFLTCDHVVSRGAYVEVARKGKLYVGFVVLRSPQYDLAVVEIKADLNLLVFDILSNKEYKNLKAGTEMYSAGYHDFRMNVALPTFGYLIKKGHEIFTLSGVMSGVAHGVGGWYGYSGGPVVTKNGKVVGINSKILKGDNPTSMWAIPATTVNEWLENNGLVSSRIPVESGLK